MAASMRDIKCVIVGDGAVGKTSLLIRYNHDRFPSDYCPTVFDNYAKHVEVEDKGERTTVNMGFWDTAGGEDYPRLRPLSYPQTDVFLLCFSVESLASFNNVTNTNDGHYCPGSWITELRHHCPHTPVVLVATKIDLRDDRETVDMMREKGQSLQTFQQGDELARQIGAAEYRECSALSNEGVKEVFEEAIKTVLQNTHVEKTKKRCCIL